MKAYFDGSGDKDSEFLVLSGVAASDATWANFQSHWNAILTNRTPVAPYVHMRELAPLRKAFSKKLGWDDFKADRLVTNCLMYAQRLDKNDFRTFTCSIDLEEYRRLITQGESLPDYYELCSYFCPEQILKWYLNNFAERFPEELHFYFDQNERHKGVFEKKWNRGKKSGRGLLNHWHLIRSVNTADMRDTPALQLADVLAWGHNRRLMIDKHGTSQNWKHVSQIAESILPSTRKPIDESGLGLMATCIRLSPELLEWIH